MSILKLFSGPSAEKLEQKGDALFEAGLWGQARLAYDRAIHKLENQTGDTGNDQERIAGKFLRSGEALAREHGQNAESFIAGGHLDEAKELLALALEITADAGFKKELEDRLHQLALQQGPEAREELPEFPYAPEEADHNTEETSEDDYFFALCGPLPEEVRDVYFEYGEDFRSGYIALNRGDFQTAAEDLSRAMEQNPQPDSYTPLELAAAYLNLDRLNEAQTLLENFLHYHPQTLPAYQLLCEIYWDQNNFLRVDALLSSVTDELAGSLAFVLLKGETLRRSGNLPGARDYYLGFMETYGWNDTAALELAKIYESLKESEDARNIYKEIMGRCNSCHARIDPVIKHRYAELCFADGMNGSEILELYLSLAREIPDNASKYFDRISRLYTAQGNAVEAERFRAFAIRAETEQDEP
ncbi:MAG: tetratricopeptide repeat protein [Desulfobacterales bacterium]